MIDQRVLLPQPGDAMPFCFGMASDRQFYSLEAQAGRAAVILLIGPAIARDSGPIIAAFAQRADAFVARAADVLILGEEDVVRPLAGSVPTSCAIRLVDCGIDFLPRCGVGPNEAAVLVIDRNRRLALRMAPSETNDSVAACLDCLDRLPAEPARDAVLPAPVVMLPNLIPPGLCRELVALFDTRPSMEGEIASVDRAGNPHSRIDHAKKWRRDLPIPPTDPLYPILRDALLGRCAPQIARAFQAKVAHIDRILVARYDDTGGWFRRHRDNVGENVAFREFAISVNLNTEEYEGGHLLFPEYNDHRYRPATGAGIIFSASLLHEATAVTRGRRYVLLTFFHGDAAEARRLAYLARSMAGPDADAGAAEPARCNSET
jgi:predicted 2-oxoglutarate/Fe(II)-dependent dioxygenase YbiX